MVPDRYGEPVEPDPVPVDVWQIVECGLCDDAGIRAGFACDHVDWAQIAKRGLAKVRAALKGTAE